VEDRLEVYMHGSLKIQLMPDQQLSHFPAFLTFLAPDGISGITGKKERTKLWFFCLLECFECCIGPFQNKRY